MVLNVIAAVSILTLAIASFVLLAKGCASDEPPGSVPVEGFRKL
jgi:hypothetical protein